MGSGEKAIEPVFKLERETSAQKISSCQIGEFPNLLKKSKNSFPFLVKSIGIF